MVFFCFFSINLKCARVAIDQMPKETLNKLGNCFSCLNFALQVREHAILLNIGSLRAIAMPELVLVFDHHR